MQSAYSPNVAPSYAASTNKQKYSGKIFVIFFFWFLLVSLMPFLNTASTGPIFQFQWAKTFFQASPHFVAIMGWVVVFVLPALIALVLLVFSFALCEKGLGALLVMIGMGHWLLFAIGPIVALIFGKSPSMYYGGMPKVTGSAIWKNSLVFWIGMALVFHAIVIVFAIFARNRAGRGGGLVMLKSVVAIPLLFLLPIMFTGAGYSSLWKVVMRSGLSLVPLVLALLPLALVLVALFVLIGCGKKRFPSKLAAALLFLYIFMPLWNVIMRLPGNNLAALSAKQLPREILSQLLLIVKAGYGFSWLSAPGFLLPTMFLTGAGVFLYVAGKSKPATAFASAAVYTPSTRVAPVAPAAPVAPMAPRAPITPAAPVAPFVTKSEPTSEPKNEDDVASEDTGATEDGDDS